MSKKGDSVWCRKFISVDLGFFITYTFNKLFPRFYHVLNPMLDVGTLVTDGTNMVPDLMRLTFHQGRRVDRSKHRNIIEISSNNDR